MNPLLEQMESGNFDFVKMLSGDKETYSEVKSLFLRIKNNLPKDTCNNLILRKIFPIIFDRTVDSNTRDQALDFGFCLLPHADISLLSTPMQESLFHAIEDTYKNIIGELRDKNDPCWTKLWIFLIKICGEKLHTRMSLSNNLLRVVEHAFRNTTSMEQRLKAYDCWVELINNSSLNMDHMCSPKQIKLLVTPMKAKFSRMVPVIIKRCDTFIYLLEKLQDRATMCIKEFLEFAFGPFHDLNDVEKLWSVAEVCRKSTKVLMEILGHSHDDKDSCLQTSDIQLYKPLITHYNVSQFADVLINSVVHCSIFLNEFNNEDPVQYNTIMKCMWHSLLKLIRPNHVTFREKCYIHINKLLWALLAESRKNHHLYEILHRIIIIIRSDTHGCPEMLVDTPLSFLCQADPTLTLNTDQLFHFLNSSLDSKTEKIRCIMFRDDLLNNKGFSAFGDFWLKSDFKMTPDNVSYLLLPISHANSFKDVKDLKSKWRKAYEECESEDVKFLLLQKMRKLFSSNPLQNSSVVNFIELIASIETNPSKQFVANFMKLIGHVLTFPNLPESEVKKLESIVLQYCDTNLDFYKAQGFIISVDKLCNCIDSFLNIHKKFSILTQLKSCWKNIKPNILNKFCKAIMPRLEILLSNENVEVSENAGKLIAFLQTKENKYKSNSITPEKSRQTVNMVDTTNKAIKKGKSTPPKSSPRRSCTKKPTSALSVNDDKSSDYVKIDTEVKIVFANMSEHQKEVLSKRREDIPALYEDLTQSQSQDFFKETRENKSCVEEVVSNPSSVDAVPLNKPKRGRPRILNRVLVFTQNETKSKLNQATVSPEQNANNDDTKKVEFEPKTINQNVPNTDLAKEGFIQAAKNEQPSSAQGEKIEQPLKDGKAEHTLQTDGNTHETTRRKSERMVKPTVKGMEMTPTKGNKKRNKKQSNLTCPNKTKEDKINTTSQLADAKDINKSSLQDGNQNKVLPSDADDKKLATEVTQESLGNSCDASCSVQSDNNKNIYEFVVDPTEPKKAVKKLRKPKSKNSMYRPFSASDYKTKRKRKLIKKLSVSDGNVSTSPKLQKNTSLQTISFPEATTKSDVPVLKAQADDTNPQEVANQTSPKLFHNTEDVIENSQAATDTVNRVQMIQSPAQSKPDNKSSTEATSEDLFPTRPCNETPKRNLDVSSPKNTSPTVILRRLSPKVSEIGTVNLIETPIETLTYDTIKTEELETQTEIPEELPINDDLPGSPITCDTPDRTMELLNNTSDISPINVTSDEIDRTPKPQPNEMKNPRVAKLLQMVNSSVQVIPRGRTWYGNKNGGSPAANFMKKLKTRKEENLDILTFSREVPSPKTVPASSILKRKLNNAEETSTPSPKRKRVNFSDPAISEKKLFIKDSLEYMNSDQGPDSTSVSDTLEEDNTDKDDGAILNTPNISSLVLSLKEHDEIERGGEYVKLIMQRVMRLLNGCEIAEVISEFMMGEDRKLVEDFERTLFASPASQQIIDKAMQTIDQTNVFTVDKMNSLIKTYASNLDEGKRNEFLFSLFNFSSGELPANKESLTRVFQSVLNKMTDQ